LIKSKYDKQYYIENRDRIVERSKNYYFSHRIFKKRFCWICDKDLSGTKKRRFCDECSPKISDLKNRLKLEVHNNRRYLIKLLGGKCIRCGNEENLHIHHINRDNKLSNFKLLCSKCHLKRDTKYYVNFNPVNLTEELKKYLKCELCSSKKYVVLHHKDFNRKDNRVGNLIFLCMKCHTLTHLQDERFKNAISKGWFKEKSCQMLSNTKNPLNSEDLSQIDEVYEG
jgi:5-methylcytosine-specific restriction endonuclease McrA